jgi:nucleotide-binding universal stress UspA family protein
VAFDGSEPSIEALEHALEDYADARITVLTVINPTVGGRDRSGRLPASSEVWFERAREEAKADLATAREPAEEHGVEIETAIEVGRPSSVIVEYAGKHDVDQVVVGSHGRKGLSRVLLGSVAESVVRRSPVPVTVVR